MSYISWTDEAKVNFEIIDDQHKSLVDLANELYTLIGTEENEKIITLLDTMVEELRVHFETEERYMTESKFQSFFSHKLEHDRHLTKVKNYADSVKNSDEVLNLEFVKSFRNWFFNHLEFNDKKCAAHFKAMGMSC